MNKRAMYPIAASNQRTKSSWNICERRRTDLNKYRNFTLGSILYL